MGIKYERQTDRQTDRQRQRERERERDQIILLLTSFTAKSRHHPVAYSLIKVILYTQFCLFVYCLRKFISRPGGGRGRGRGGGCVCVCVGGGRYSKVG